MIKYLKDRVDYISLRAKTWQYSNAFNSICSHGKPNIRLVRLAHAQPHECASFSCLFFRRVRDKNKNRAGNVRKRKAVKESFTIIVYKDFHVLETIVCFDV